MLKGSLLGAGRIGNVHAKAISAHSGSQLVAVSDVNMEAAQKLAGQYGAQAATSDQVVNDVSIDAVLMATSTDTHPGLIKAVFC